MFEPPNLEFWKDTEIIPGTRVGFLKGAVKRLELSIPEGTRDLGR